MRALVAVMALSLALAACDTVSQSVQGLRDRLADIDIEETLEGLRDCDRLSDTFVGLVGGAADTVDSLAERTNGRIPETDIREAVDKIAVTQFYEIAERIGCAQVQQRLEVVDQLRGLDPDTPAGEDFLEEILRQVESGA
jgi:hypothetical protein